MAKYTIELRHVVENHNIFHFNYPFFGGDLEREKFEQDFIKHFYFREIGFETIDRFVWNLRDKMETVFPYYNKLLETASIDYSILDNYNLTETTVSERENRNRSTGIASTVGRLIDDQQTDTSNTMKGSGTNSDFSSSDSETSRTGISETVGNGETLLNESNNATSDSNGNVTKTGDTTTSENGSATKKFLETPSGVVNLSESDYLTNLTNDSSNKTGDMVANESEVSETFGTQSSERESKNTTKDSNTTNRDEKDVASVVNTGNSSSTVEQKNDGSVTHSQEQKTTNDSNTRSETEGSHREQTTISRRGNIGIDTDADMIQKHIKLQQILANIKKMFFDECEDLFMGVY